MSEETTKSTTSMALNSKLKQATILSIFEEYSRYLLKQHTTDSKEEVKEKVGKIVSIVMERGDCTSADLNHVVNYIEKHNIHTKFSSFNNKRKKFEQHVLIEEMSELMEAGNAGFTEAETKQFNLAIEAQKNADVLFYSLLKEYGDRVDTNITSFFSVYGKLFDETFIDAKFFNKAEGQTVPYCEEGTIVEEPIKSEPTSAE